MKYGPEAACPGDQHVVSVIPPDPFHRAMTERDNDRNREQELRDDHGSRRKQSPKSAQRPRARQQQIKRETDDDRWQSK